MVASDLVMTMDTIPLAMVTVPSPLSVRVTSGPVPVPPPGRLASAGLGQKKQAASRAIPRRRVFIRLGIMLRDAAPLAVKPAQKRLSKLTMTRHDTIDSY